VPLFPFAMPTLLVLDCSLSMLRRASSDAGSILDLAKSGLDQLLSHVETTHKLEHVSLVCYSSEVFLYTPFQRDVADIRQRLATEVDCVDTANVVRMLRSIIPLVNEHWGAGVDVKVRDHFQGIQRFDLRFYKIRF
jgi:hypothetical protein